MARNIFMKRSKSAPVRPLSRAYWLRERYRIGEHQPVPSEFLSLFNSFQASQ